MQKLAFAIPNLGPSQLSYYLARNANSYMPNKPDVTIFYEQQTQPAFNYSAVLLPIIEAYNYSGTLVATSLNTAQKLISFPGPTRKLFYVWDLEWLRIKQKNFSELQSIYRNNQLEIFSRSQSHKLAIEECWNVKVKAIVEDFGDFKEFLEL